MKNGILDDIYARAQCVTVTKENCARNIGAIQDGQYTSST
jgi:hypothetical protein